MYRLWLVVKPLPVLCLGWWVLGAPKSTYRNRLAAGLALSLAGDVLIEWSFVAGLAAFLLAHIAYVAAFLADTKRPRLLRAVPIAGYGAGGAGTPCSHGASRGWRGKCFQPARP